MVTCVCLQSAPLAGSLIFLKVTGHLSETFTPVCCTLSSELLKNNFLTVCTCVCGHMCVHVCVYVCVCGGGGGGVRMEEDWTHAVKKIERVCLICPTSQTPTSITTTQRPHWFPPVLNERSYNQLYSKVYIPQERAIHEPYTLTFCNAVFCW